MFVWDDIKNLANRAKHGIDFSAAYEFDEWSLVRIDRTCEQDGEDRFGMIGILYGKLHTMIYAVRGEDIRIISLRRSNKQEEKIYEKSPKDQI